METSPKINNVKVHFKICKKVTLKDNLSHNCDTVWHHNFAVVRWRYVYTIWFNSGVINITGIPTIDDIRVAVADICELLEIRETDIKCFPIIDNITASGKLGKNIDLKKLKAAQKINIAYNPDIFTGAFCKTDNGTIIIFSTGSYNIVGAKCQHHVSTIFTLLNAAITML